MMEIRLRRVIPSAAVMLGAVACDRSSEAGKDSAAAPAPVVIDTMMPTIMGYAVKRESGDWCLVTSRSGMWNGKPLNLIVLREERIHSAYVRDTVPSCAPADSTPGALFFALELKHPQTDSGSFAIVVRDDIWGGLGRPANVYETNLDGIEGKEFLQECVGERNLNLFATSDSTNGRLRWRHGVPLNDDLRSGRPHCDGRLGEPRAPAVAQAPPSEDTPRGGIVFPTTRTFDPGASKFGWKAVRQIGNQMEVLEAAAIDFITEPACPGSGAVSGRGLRPQISGEWIAMINNVYPVRESTSPAPRIIGTGPRRIGGDSVVVLFEGRPLILRSEQSSDAGFAIYTEVMGARSTLFTSGSLAGSWTVPLAVDYDGDNAVDVMISVTTGAGTESRFYISTQRPLMGGTWPAAAARLTPAC